MNESLPAEVQITIIGGGIIGCSVAYHLANEGTKDILLLERGQLTCGSTFHAAGLVGQLRSSANITQVLKNSVDLYRKIELETGQATGWKMNGGMRLACTKDRWTELKRQATTAHSFGLDMELLSPHEAKKLWPLMKTDDIVGAAFYLLMARSILLTLLRLLPGVPEERGLRSLKRLKLLEYELKTQVYLGAKRSQLFKQKVEKYFAKN